MTRRISSLNTALAKLLPLPLAGAVILVIAGLLTHALALFPDGLFVLGFTLAALVFFSWRSSLLKFVRVDDDTLYVFDWFKRIAIPLSEVDDVNYSGGIGLVFVRFKSPSDFGSKIAFMPTFGASIFSMLGSGSVAEELRELVKKASINSKGAI